MDKIITHSCPPPPQQTYNHTGKHEKHVAMSKSRPKGTRTKDVPQAKHTKQFKVIRYRAC